MASQQVTEIVAKYLTEGAKDFQRSFDDSGEAAENLNEPLEKTRKTLEQTSSELNEAQADVEKYGAAVSVSSSKISLLESDTKKYRLALQESAAAYKQSLLVVNEYNEAQTGAAWAQKEVEKQSRKFKIQQSQLNAAIAENKKQIELYGKELSGLKDKYGENYKETKRYTEIQQGLDAAQKMLDKSTSKLDQTNVIFKTTIEGAKNAAAEYTNTIRNLKDSYSNSLSIIEKYEAAQKNLKATQRDLKSESEALSKAERSLAVANERARQSSDEFNKSSKKLSARISKLNPKLKDLKVATLSAVVAMGSAMSQIGQLSDIMLNAQKAVISTSGAFFKYGVASSIEYETHLISLQKVIPATEVSFDSFGNLLVKNGKLTKAARDEIERLSFQYGVSSNEILDAIGEFKRAGFELADAMALQKTSIDFAIAGELEQAKATISLVKIMKGYSDTTKSVEQQNRDAAAAAKHYGDAINEVSVNYALNADLASKAVASSAAIAKQAGFEFDELLGVLTPMIEVFQQASPVSRAFNATMLRLTSSVPAVVQELAKLGVVQRDGAGVMKSAKQIYLETSEAFNKLSEAEKVVSLNLIAGKDHAPKMAIAFQTLAKQAEITKVSLNASAGGAILVRNSLGELEQAVNDKGEPAYRKIGSMANEVAARQSSAATQLDRVNSGFETLARTVGDKLLPLLGSYNNEKGLLEGISSIENSIVSLITGGKFDEIFNVLQFQTKELGDMFNNIASNLPMAFNGVDLSPITDRLEETRKLAIEMFNAFMGRDIDLNTVEGLEMVLQRIVNTASGLFNVTNEIIRSYKPILIGFGELVSGTGDATNNMQKRFGEMLGIFKQFQDFGPVFIALSQDISATVEGISRYWAVLSGGAAAVYDGIKLIAQGMAYIASAQLGLYAGAASWFGWVSDEQINAINNSRDAMSIALSETSIHAKNATSKMVEGITGMSASVSDGAKKTKAAIDSTSDSAKMGSKVIAEENSKLELQYKSLSNAYREMRDSLADDTTNKDVLTNLRNQLVQVENDLVNEQSSLLKNQYESLNKSYQELMSKVSDSAAHKDELASLRKQLVEIDKQIIEVEAKKAVAQYNSLLNAYQMMVNNLTDTDAHQSALRDLRTQIVAMEKEVVAAGGTIQQEAVDLSNQVKTALRADSEAIKASYIEAGEALFKAKIAISEGEEIKSPLNVLEDDFNRLGEIAKKLGITLPKEIAELAEKSAIAADVAKEMPNYESMSDMFLEKQREMIVLTERLNKLQSRGNVENAFDPEELQETTAQLEKIRREMNYIIEDTKEAGGDTTDMIAEFGHAQLDGITKTGELMEKQSERKLQYERDVQESTAETANKEAALYEKNEQKLAEILSGKQKAEEDYQNALLSVREDTAKKLMEIDKEYRDRIFDLDQEQRRAASELYTDIRNLTLEFYATQSELRKRFDADMSALQSAQSDNEKERLDSIVSKQQELADNERAIRDNSNQERVALQESLDGEIATLNEQRQEQEAQLQDSITEKEQEATEKRLEIEQSLQADIAALSDGRLATDEQLNDERVKIEAATADAIEGINEQLAADIVALSESKQSRLLELEASRQSAVENIAKNIDKAGLDLADNRAKVASETSKKINDIEAQIAKTKLDFEAQIEAKQKEIQVNRLKRIETLSALEKEYNAKISSKRKDILVAQNELETDLAKKRADADKEMQQARIASTVQLEKEKSAAILEHEQRTADIKQEIAEKQASIQAGLAEKEAKIKNDLAEKEGAASSEIANLKREIANETAQHQAEKEKERVASEIVGFDKSLDAFKETQQQKAAIVAESNQRIDALNNQIAETQKDRVRTIAEAELVAKNGELTEEDKRRLDRQEIAQKETEFRAALQAGESERAQQLAQEQLDLAKGLSDTERVAALTDAYDNLEKSLERQKKQEQQNANEATIQLKQADMQIQSIVERKRELEQAPLILEADVNTDKFDDKIQRLKDKISAVSLGLGETRIGASNELSAAKDDANNQLVKLQKEGEEKLKNAANDGNERVAELEKNAAEELAKNKETLDGELTKERENIDAEKVKQQQELEALRAEYEAQKANIEKEYAKTIDVSAITELETKRNEELQKLGSKITEINSDAQKELSALSSQYAMTVKEYQNEIVAAQQVYIDSVEKLNTDTQAQKRELISQSRKAAAELNVQQASDIKALQLQFASDSEYLQSEIERLTAAAEAEKNKIGQGLSESIQALQDADALAFMAYQKSLQASQAAFNKNVLDLNKETQEELADAAQVIADEITKINLDFADRDAEIKEEIKKTQEQYRKEAADGAHAYNEQVAAITEQRRQNEAEDAKQRKALEEQQAKRNQELMEEEKQRKKQVSEDYKKSLEGFGKATAESNKQLSDELGKLSEEQQERLGRLNERLAQGNAELTSELKALSEDTGLSIERLINLSSRKIQNDQQAIASARSATKQIAQTYSDSVQPVDELSRRIEGLNSQIEYFKTTEPPRWSSPDPSGWENIVDKFKKSADYQRDLNIETDLWKEKTAAAGDEYDKIGKKLDEQAKKQEAINELERKELEYKDKQREAEKEKAKQPDDRRPDKTVTLKLKVDEAGLFQDVIKNMQVKGILDAEGMLVELLKPQLSTA